MATFLGILIAVAWQGVLVFGVLWLAVAACDALLLGRLADRLRGVRRSSGSGADRAEAALFRLLAALTLSCIAETSRG